MYPGACRALNRHPLADPKKARELENEIVVQVRAVDDDVRLRDREHGIARRARLGQQKAVPEDGNEVWRRLDQLADPCLLFLERRRHRSPTRWPQIGVLDVELQALPEPGKPLVDRV